jgi:hypothetical protein
MELFNQIKHFFWYKIIPSNTSSTYYELTKNIRNYNILTTDEIEYIQTLSKEQLLEIITIYDLHTQVIKPILEDC